MPPNSKIVKSTSGKKKSTKKEGNKTKVTKTKNKRNRFLQIKCPICFENFAKQPVSSTICGHIFCTECLLRAIRMRPACPTCRRSLRSSKTHHLVYFDSCVIDDWE